MIYAIDNGKEVQISPYRTSFKNVSCVCNYGFFFTNKMFFYRLSLKVGRFLLKAGIMLTFEFVKSIVKTKLFFMLLLICAVIICKNLDLLLALYNLKIC